MYSTREVAGSQHVVDRFYTVLSEKSSPLDLRVEGVGGEGQHGLTRPCNIVWIMGSIPKAPFAVLSPRLVDEKGHSQMMTKGVHSTVCTHVHRKRRTSPLGICFPVREA